MESTAKNPFSCNLHSRDGTILYFEKKRFIISEPKYRPTKNEIFPLIFSPIIVKRSPYHGPNMRPEIPVNSDAGKKMSDLKEYNAT